MEAYNIGFNETNGLVCVTAHAKCKYRQHDRYLGHIDIKEGLFYPVDEAVPIEFLKYIALHWDEYELSLDKAPF